MTNAWGLYSMSTAVAVAGFACLQYSGTVVKADLMNMRLSQAPAVDDVRYGSLATHPSSQAYSKGMEIALASIVLILWVPFTGIIASSTSLEDL